MLKGLLGWERILVLRNSLVSRVLTVFSVSVIVLSSLDPVLDVLQSTWRYTVVYAGSIVFFAGYIFAQFRAPVEFSETPFISEIINRMKARNSKAVFESRIDMIESLVNRMTPKPPVDIPDGILDYAQDTAVTARQHLKDHSWREEQGELYYCDLNVRQFDRTRGRFVSTGLMTLGFALILLPTIVSAVSIPVSFLFNPDASAG